MNRMLLPLHLLFHQILLLKNSHTAKDHTGLALDSIHKTHTQRERERERERERGRERDKERERERGREREVLGGKRDTEGGPCTLSLTCNRKTVWPLLRTESTAHFIATWLPLSLPIATATNLFFVAAAIPQMPIYLYFNKIHNFANILFFLGFWNLLITQVLIIK